MASYKFDDHKLAFDMSNLSVSIITRSTSSAVATEQLVQPGNDYVRIALFEDTNNDWVFEMSIVQSTTYTSKLEDLMDLEAVDQSKQETLKIRGNDGIRPPLYLLPYTRGQAGSILALKNSVLYAQ